MNSQETHRTDNSDTLVGCRIRN